MKIKTTKQFIKNNSATLWACGYCDLQYLLRAVDPFAYSAGAYGWACDYYNLTPYIVLSTGYSPVGVRLPFNIVKKYDNKAAKIWNDYDKYKTYESRKKAVLKLVDKFVAEIREHLDKNPLNNQ